jgi:hypothetical protein
MKYLTESEMKILAYLQVYEPNSSVVSIPDLYLGGPEFRPQYGEPYYEGCIVFISPSRKWGTIP